MATHQINQIQTQTGIKSDEVIMHSGNAKVQAFTHGSTNTLHTHKEDVTAQRENEVMLVKLVELYKQRGGNPFFGPMAGRYGPKIAQPGTMDIHGVFGGLEWDLTDVNDNESFIQMELPASKWKNELINYYIFAARLPDGFSDERRSLDRLIQATLLRYKGQKEIVNYLKELESIINKSAVDSNLGRVDQLISFLINTAFPGEANIIRRITIEQSDDQVTSFLDNVWIVNSSDSENYLDSSGYHTYFNTFLEEIIVPRGFWKNGVVQQDYDDNLPNVRVQELDQTQRLDRRVFIIPEGELKNRNANQIIYRDANMIGYPEVAIENWYQPGDAAHYPDTGNILLPGKTAEYGVRIVVVQGSEVPQDILDYVNQVNAELGIVEA